MIANYALYKYDERFKFTGKERDWESGYDFFGARFYSSLYGFRTRVDPLADKYSGVTPYIYCNGNPIMFIDPDGRDDEWSWNGETATRTHIDNGPDFVRVNGRLITTYDYSQENIENIDMLEAILPYYCDQAGIEQTKGCAYFAFPATALTDFSDNRLIGLVVDEDGYIPLINLKEKLPTW